MTFPASDSSTTGSSAPTVGASLRRARKAAGLSMKALAVRAGVSQPFVSQVENERASPSITTLYRLAEALDLSPGDLMPHLRSDEVRVMRSGEGVMMPTSDHPRSATGRVIAPGQGGGLEFIEYRVDPSERLDDWFEFPGELVVYVVEGHLEVEVEGHSVWEMGPQDAIHHDSAMRHRWRPAGDGPVFLLFAAVRHPAG